MKKSILLTLILGTAALAQGPRAPGGGFGRGPGMFGAGPGGGRGALVTGAPYSAVSVVQSQEVLADGNRITNQRSTSIARDGSGRIWTEETIKAPAGSTKPATTLITILDYVGGNRYLLDSSTMTAYQSPLRTPRAGGGRMQMPPTPPASATTRNGATVNTTTLGPQQINGVLATGTQITQTIPAGAIGNAQPIQITRVTWISNDLKVPVQIKSSDPRFGTTDMELTNIVQAEPSASLFVVPPGYTLKTNGRSGMMGGFERGPRGGAPPQR